MNEHWCTHMCMCVGVYEFVFICISVFVFVGLVQEQWKMRFYVSDFKIDFDRRYVKHYV